MNWEWIDARWPERFPSRLLLLRYFSSGLSILALIAVYIGAANGKSWGPVVLILAVAAFGVRFFVGPPPQEARMIDAVGGAVRRTTDYFIPHGPGAASTHFTCRACGAKNSSSSSEAGRCAYCDSPSGVS